MKELHIYTDKVPHNLGFYSTYKETEKAIERHEDIIHTTQLQFFSLSVHLNDGYDIYVHNNGEIIVLHDMVVSGYGKVRYSQNIYSMLMSGCFGLI